MSLHYHFDEIDIYLYVSIVYSFSIQNNLEIVVEKKNFISFCNDLFCLKYTFQHYTVRFNGFVLIIN